MRWLQCRTPLPSVSLGIWGWAVVCRFVPPYRLPRCRCSPRSGARRGRRASVEGEPQGDCPPKRRRLCNPSHHRIAQLPYLTPSLGLAACKVCIGRPSGCLAFSCRLEGRFTCSGPARSCQPSTDFSAEERSKHASRAPQFDHCNPMAQRNGNLGHRCGRQGGTDAPGKEGSGKRTLHQLSLDGKTQTQATGHDVFI